MLLAYSKSLKSDRECLEWELRTYHFFRQAVKILVTLREFLSKYVLDAIGCIMMGLITKRQYGWSELLHCVISPVILKAVKVKTCNIFFLIFAQNKDCGNTNNSYMCY